MEISFNFDLERMKRAVESPTIRIPEGLTREEKRKYILEKIHEIEEVDIEEKE